MIHEYLRFAYENFRKRQLRSWLTMLGIVIGVAALVSLVSVGQGLQATITEQFEMMGIDKLIVYPGSDLAGLGMASTLTDDDVDVVRKTRGVKLAGGMLYKIARVNFRNENKYTFVTGMPADETQKIIEDMQSVDIIEGRNLKETDKYKTIIGYELGYDATLFKEQMKVGDRIKVLDKSFDVVGVMSRIGNRQDDTQLIVPLDAAREVFEEPEEISAMIAQVEKGLDTGQIAEDVKKNLRKRRNLEAGEEDFSVQTTEDLRESFSVIFTVVQAVIIGLAAISLVVGGIGIMNTMYTAVLERTREIGIMKAVGARNSDILLIFLIESGLLGLTGGTVGIAIGIGISKGIDIAAGLAGVSMLETFFPWYLVVGALVFSFGVGVVSGTLPAMQAARQKPADSLRYE